jgi:nitroimidazol reductase NimA-like FMN-containing flavoprotein (pyridoxamine 5'-phosphate oxidase superfamily)
MITDPVRTSPLGARAMTEEEIENFLKRVIYGTLSYPNRDGWPDARVFNFTYFNGMLYFHSGKRGEKLDNLPDGTKVCVSMFEPSQEIGRVRFCHHESVLFYGRLKRLDALPEHEEEIRQILTKMSFDNGTPYKAAPERIVKTMFAPSVFRIEPEHVAGKLTYFATLPE